MIRENLLGSRLWRIIDKPELERCSCGYLFYKRIVGEVNPHRFSDYEHIAAHNYEMPQYTVDMYLCQDGKTISNSKQYQFGPENRSIHAVFRNRDPRLWHVVMPPFRVLSKTEATAYPELGAYQEDGIPADKNWFFTNKPEDREFIDIFGANHGQSVSTATLPFGGDLNRGMKRLPTQKLGRCSHERGTPFEQCNPYERSLSDLQ